MDALNRAVTVMEQGQATAARNFGDLIAVIREAMQPAKRRRDADDDSA